MPWSFHERREHMQKLTRLQNIVSQYGIVTGRSDEDDADGGDYREDDTLVPTL